MGKIKSLFYMLFPRKNRYLWVFDGHWGFSFWAKSLDEAKEIVIKHRMDNMDNSRQKALSKLEEGDDMIFEEIGHL